jgi:hypothetical protein
LIISGAPSRTPSVFDLWGNRNDFASLLSQNLLVVEPVVASQLFSVLVFGLDIINKTDTLVGYYFWRAQQDSLGL